MRSVRWTVRGGFLRGVLWALWLALPAASGAASQPAPAIATQARAEVAVDAPTLDRPASPAPVRPRFIFETGLFAGGARDIPDYDESVWRLYGEAGVEWFGKERGRPRTAGVGLVVFGCLGSGDHRVGYGPRATVRLDPRWAAQASTGPLWSSEDESRGFFDRGWHTRTSLIYRDTVSLSVLWQTLPYHSHGPVPESGRLHSLYAGAMVHGNAGRTSSLILWSLLAAGFITIVATMPPI